MTTAYPTTLDTFLDPVGTSPTLNTSTPSLGHAFQHDLLNDAVFALQVKIGVDQSSDTNSLDYKIRHAALLVSPTFSGAPTAPTPALGDNTTQLATTAFVHSALAGAGAGGGVVGPSSSVSGNLVTFNGATGQVVQDSGVQPSALALLVSPVFSGVPQAPTAALDTSSAQLATTGFVVNQGYAKLISAPLTGTPTAPTPAPGTNTAQLATTAFVTAAVTSSGSRLLQLYTSGGATPITGRGIATSGTGETFLFAAKVPGNSVHAASTFRVTVASAVPAFSTTYSLSLRVGSTGTLSDTLIIHCSEAQSNASGYWLTALVQVLALGAPSTVTGHGILVTSGNWPTPDTPPEVVANVPTSSDWYIVGTAQSGSSGNPLTTQIVSVETV